MSVTHTFVVTNANDSGTGSLRAEILLANAADVFPNNFSTINFNIPATTGSTSIILPKSALPTLGLRISLNGATEPNGLAAGIPRVALLGASAGSSNGLILEGSDGIKGLALWGFKLNGILAQRRGSSTISGCAFISNGNDGILVSSAHNTISSNKVGTDTTGTSAYGNGNNGIEVSAPYNTLTGNLVSGNKANGILLGPAGSHTVLVKNYIGTNAAGTAAIPNSTSAGNGGVLVESSYNTIGKTGQGNLISGNNTEGILVAPWVTATTDVTGNLIQGNTIGTTLNGEAALPNNGGIVEDTFNGNYVDFQTSINGNLISGNGASGIQLASIDDVITSNTIGADRTNSKALGNGGYGIDVEGLSGNVIGKIGQGNYICANREGGIYIPSANNDSLTGNYIGVGANGVALGNYGNGVEVDDPQSTGNAILNNSIFANTGLGIHLLDGNNSQPAPVLTAGSSTAGISGTLSAAKNTTYTIQFFSNPLGAAQGLTFLGSRTVTTDSTGHASFTDKALSGVLKHEITATATDPGGDTSEFSNGLKVYY